MLEATLTAEPVIGMVHLRALPGAPDYGGSMEDVLARARRDARALDAGGVDAVLVENFGDAPFYPDEVPKHVVASMTRATRTVVRAVDVPVGVNVLRNDARAALSVAAAAGGSFVRVNVHGGARVTDQGVIEGAAHETIRLRDRLDADVRVLADHDVKHSAPLGSDAFVEGSLVDAVERGHADGIVVSGAGTGRGVDRDDLTTAVRLRDEAGLDAPVFVGSGVTTETVGDLLSTADGVVVGTSLKRGGETTAPVDSERVRELVEAARA